MTSAIDEVSVTVNPNKVLTLYGGTGCHLCENLEALYGVRIPVLKTPSGTEKAWPFSEGQVRRLLLAEQKKT